MITFIINPKNKHKCKEFNNLTKELQKKHTIEVIETEGIADGIKKAKQASENNSDYIIAVGGDGTINEIANGIMQSKIEKKPILGIYKCGTGDDFIKSLSNRDLKDAFVDIKIREIDILKITFTDKNNNQQCRYSVNIGEIGVGGLTVKIVNGSKKRLGSALTFFAGALKAFIKYNPNNVKITGDDFNYSGKITAVVFANGKYFGGGMCIAPDAILDDGYMNITLAGDIKTSTFLRYSPKLRKRQKLEHEQVFYYKTKTLKVENISNTKSELEADGEFLGYTPIKVEILHKALKIII